MKGKIRWPAWLAPALLALASAVAWAAPLGFTAGVSEKLIMQLADRFGRGAIGRLQEWKRLPQDLRAPVRDAAPRDLALLRPVNAFFNRLPFVSDLEHWGVDDYWATPAEALASNGADCEDFSLAKYFMLKELGVPTGSLRITYVVAKRLNQAHMVLAYYPTPDADPWILDNLEETVRRGSERTDLVPTYSFNDDEVWLPGAEKIGSPLQIRMWRDLLAKLERESRVQ